MKIFGDLKNIEFFGGLQKDDKIIIGKNVDSCNEQILNATMKEISDFVFLELTSPPPPKVTVFFAAVDNSWHNFLNWDNGVPAAADTAIIAFNPKGVYPVLSQNVEIANLTIEPGAMLFGQQFLNVTNETVFEDDVNDALGAWKMITLPDKEFAAAELTFGSKPRVAMSKMSSDTTSTIKWASFPATEIFTAAQALLYQINPADDMTNFNGGILKLPVEFVNDDVTVPFAENTRFIFVGNPYLCEIDIDKFFAANPDLNSAGYYIAKSGATSSSIVYQTVKENLKVGGCAIFQQNTDYKAGQINFSLNQAVDAPKVETKDTDVVLTQTNSIIKAEDIAAKSTQQLFNSRAAAAVDTLTEHVAIYELRKTKVPNMTGETDDPTERMYQIINADMNAATAQKLKLRVFRRKKGTLRRFFAPNSIKDNLENHFVDIDTAKTAVFDFPIIQHTSEPNTFGVLLSTVRIELSKVEKIIANNIDTLYLGYRNHNSKSNYISNTHNPNISSDQKQARYTLYVALIDTDGRAVSNYLSLQAYSNTVTGIQIL